MYTQYRLVNDQTRPLEVVSGLLELIQWHLRYRRHSWLLRSDVLQMRMYGSNWKSNMALLRLLHQNALIFAGLYKGALYVFTKANICIIIHENDANYYLPIITNTQHRLQD